MSEKGMCAMKKRRVVAFMMAVMLCLSLVISDQEAFVAAAQDTSTTRILETDVASPSSGCTMLLVSGSYYSQAQEALDRINEIRKEACEAGNVPDPRNESRMLSASDYVPIKWSRDLESIARIRAMESSMTMAHARLNGKAWSSISYNNVSSWGEVLAWNFKNTMVSGINQWYGEKSDWVGKVSGKVTGHYTSMIDPSNTYIGLGEFYNNDAYYPNTVAGEFSGRSTLDETMQEAYSDVMQKVEVLESRIKGYVLDGMDMIYTEQSERLTPKVEVTYESHTYKLDILEDVTYISSDPSVARVDQDGLVTGIKSGSAVITAKRDGSVFATLTMTVKCNHEKELISYTAPSCTSTGEKVYRCEQCGEAVTETVAKVPHDYVYSEADSDGKKTGVCSMCGDTIKITPPTTYTLYWRNETSTDSYYWSYFPSENPIGTKTYLLPKVQDGDSDYQELMARSSDESVIQPPDKIVNKSGNNAFKIVSPGIATITVYPKYNASLKRTYVVRIGDTGSVSITPAEVTLSKTSYEYDNKACTPEVSVVYHDTKLTKGTDYTVTYENNDRVGTATAVITGSGIFTGTIRKTFTITGDASDTTTTEQLGTTTTQQVTTAVQSGTTTTQQVTTAAQSGTTTTQQVTTAVQSGTTTTQQVTTAVQSGATTTQQVTTAVQPGVTTTQQNSSEITPPDSDTSQTPNPVPPTTQAPDTDDKDKDIDNTTQKKTTTEKADTDDDFDEDLDEDDDLTYPKVGDRFSVKGIKYKVVYVSKKNEDYRVVCIGATSKKITKATIPDYVSDDDFDYEVTGIAKNAFAGCKKLKSVAIPDFVTTIDAKAFYGCSALKTVTIPDAVKKIGTKAFAKCKALRFVKIQSKKLTKQGIGSKAFSRIHKHATGKVPASKKSAYKKWFKKVGLTIK